LLLICYQTDLLYIWLLTLFRPGVGHMSSKYIFTYLGPLWSKFSTYRFWIFLNMPKDHFRPIKQRWKNSNLRGSKNKIHYGGYMARGGKNILLSVNPALWGKHFLRKCVIYINIWQTHMIYLRENNNFIKGLNHVCVFLPTDIDRKHYLNPQCIQLLS
jgi:hypothetical protein